VLAVQDRYRAALESEPVRFFVRECQPLLDKARSALATFVGASPETLAFVKNATTGVNTVLRSLPFRPDEELLVTDQEYNACRNAIDFVAGQSGAKVVVAKVPFPIECEERAIEALLERVSRRTRLLLIDHVTSQTGLVFPVARLLAEAKSRGIRDIIVDGAHAPGMIPLDLRSLGAVFYTGNCHKWLCAPKGAAFLYVPEERQSEIRPLTISHGANAPVTDLSRFRLEFDWTGTEDPTPYLCVPDAIATLGSILPGGWPELMKHNRELALAGRRTLTNALGVAAPSPDSMIGSLAALPLPESGGSGPMSAFATDPLQDALFFQHRIEVPVVPWPAPPKRLIRISAQIYNTPAEYERLAGALKTLLALRKGP
jgi:isopenicillin-N epimerase